jgi:hypothetical protein
VKTLYVFCEGPTEQRFCGEVLAPHLLTCGFLHVPTVLVEFSRRKGVINRGGVKSYTPLRRDIVNKMRQRPEKDVFFTTMLDLYGLPRTFPGKKGLVRNPANPTPYVEALEAEFARDIGHRRFVPHIQLHEYETLLFADPEAFQISFENCQQAITGLKAIVASYPTIEHINDGKTAAPSKQIVALLPEYEALKSVAGPDIAVVIGLPVLRQQCPQFDTWVGRLEAL